MSNLSLFAFNVFCSACKHSNTYIQHEAALKEVADLGALYTGFILGPVLSVIMIIFVIWIFIQAFRDY